MTKEKATLKMIIRWLDSNIDEGGFENNEAKDLLAVDSRDLKEKIELALDPQTTVEQIENGDL